jgi:hypothetical protein
MHHFDAEAGETHFEKIFQRGTVHIGNVKLQFFIERSITVVAVPHV